MSDIEEILSRFDESMMENNRLHSDSRQVETWSVQLTENARSLREQSEELMRRSSSALMAATQLSCKQRS